MGVEELVPVEQRDRIEHEMIVILIGVAVRRDHNLVLISPQTLRQLDADLMGRFRVHFSRRKGLIAMVADSTACFVFSGNLGPDAFRLHKLLRRVFLRAVQTGDIHALFGFHVVRRVLHDAVDRVEGGKGVMTFLRCLFRVPGVIDDLINPTLDRPHGRDCHQCP